MRNGGGLVVYCGEMMLNVHTHAELWCLALFSREKTQELVCASYAHSAALYILYTWSGRRARAAAQQEKSPNAKYALQPASQRSPRTLKNHVQNYVSQGQLHFRLLLMSYKD